MLASVCHNCHLYCQVKAIFFIIQFTWKFVEGEVYIWNYVNERKMWNRVRSDYDHVKRDQFESFLAFSSSHHLPEHFLNHSNFLLQDVVFVFMRHHLLAPLYTRHDVTSFAHDTDHFSSHCDSGNKSMTCYMEAWFVHRSTSTVHMQRQAAVFTFLHTMSCMFSRLTAVGWRVRLGVKDAIPASLKAFEEKCLYYRVPLMFMADKRKIHSFCGNFRIVDCLVFEMRCFRR